MTLAVNPTAEKTEAMFQAMAIAQNGTGSATAITGGTSNTSAPPPPGSSAAAAAGSASGLTTGTGTIGTDGACQCAVMCPLARGNLPSADVQGRSNFGGMVGESVRCFLTLVRDSDKTEHDRLTRSHHRLHSGRQHDDVNGDMALVTVIGPSVQRLQSPHVFRFP